MKRLLITTLGLVLMFSRAGAQTPVFDNEGIFSYIMPPQAAPQIDAPLFINHGQFYISNYYTFSTVEGLGLAQAALPFESSNTRVYTNTFLMTGDPGLRLDRFDTSAGRSFPADLIVNAPSANVDSATMFGDWELTLNATNIINRGILAIGESGHLVLDAPGSIDLARSTLTAIGTDVDPAAYTKPLYWGANRSGIFGVGLVPGFPQSFDPTFFTAPTLATTWATPIGGVYPFDSFYFPTNAFFDFISGFTTYQQRFTQGDGKTVVEALFLSQTNPAISSVVQFLGFGGWGSVKIVQFQALETNRVTGEVYTNQLYVHDLFPALDDQYLGLGQNTPLDIYWAVYNLQNVMKTYVPGEVLTNALFGIGSSGTAEGHGITNLYVLDGGVFPITRSPLFYIPFGLGTTVSPGSYDPTWFQGTNVPPSVTNAVLGMKINASAWMPDASVQGSTFSNLVGRIDINAGKVLDLTRVRIDGSSFLNIRATNHFVGSSNAVIMSPYSQFDLRTTNVTMNVANLTTPTIPRINGTIDIWSARWTNNSSPIYGGPGMVYHVTVIDSHLNEDAPSQITSFTAHAKNLVLSDQLNIFSNLFLPDTVALTITTNGPTGATDAGGITLSSGDLVWSSSFPHLLYLTNYGTIATSNTLYLSTTPYPPNFYPGQTAYWTFVNHGSVVSEGQQIYADYVLSDGLQSADVGGDMVLKSGSAILTNGEFEALFADVNLSAQTLLVLSNETIVAGRRIDLTSPNWLTDLVPNIATLPRANQLTASITNGNFWSTGVGLNLTSKPAFGDLLGTTIYNLGYPLTPISINWAGENRGTSDDGFLNNAAIGHLILDGQTNSLFVFGGPGANNAIYVDLLDIRNWAATNTDSSGNLLSVTASPNTYVYFADATANGIDISEKLGASPNGHFVWVSNYNYGYFSSTNLVYPDGSTNRLNRALVINCDINSRGDGGPGNCSVPNPVPFAAPWQFPSSNPFAPAWSPGLSDVPASFAGLLATVPDSGIVPDSNATAGSDGSSGSTSGGGNSGGNNSGGNNSGGTNPAGTASDSSGSSSGLQQPSDGSTNVVAFNASAPGTYNGLFFGTNGIGASTAGYLTAKVTANGAYSGKATLAGRSYSFSGKLSSSGTASNIVKLGSSGQLTMKLALGTNLLKGTISGTALTASVEADRLVYTKSAPASFNGGIQTYTVQIGSLTNSGFGFGTVKVSPLGAVQFAGTLADGSKVTQSSTVSKDGYWPAYVSLYSGKGLVMSWLQFANNTTNSLGSSLAWVKPAGAYSKYYPGGFTNSPSVQGFAYSRPSSGSALKLNQGAVLLIGGNLGQAGLQINFTNLNNKITSAKTNKLSLSVNASTGTFQGSVLNPQTKRSIPFQGVLGSGGNNGLGFFLAPDSQQSGAVSIGTALQ